MHRTAIIIAFPQLAGIVDQWRMETVDVARRGVPPHVTVLFPWVNSPVSEHDLSVVSDVCKQTPSFDIEFDKLKKFDAGTVYFAVENNENILRLAKAIWNEFPDTPPYGGQHKHPIPHLTVAQGNHNNIDTLYDEILIGLGDTLPVSSAVHEIVVIEENGQGQWEIRATMALA